MHGLEHVVHPVRAVYDENSKVLILGTMASPASRKMGFFYGHPQNRFWKVMSDLFDDDPGETAESRRDFALRHGISLSDVISECDILGASDASIRNPVPMDLSPIMDAADIRAVFTTGTKASQLYRRLQSHLWPDIPHIPLSSTSAANARMRLPDLVREYGVIADVARDAGLAEAASGMSDAVSSAHLTERADESTGTSEEKPYFVYMARCADDTLYTGITDDIEKRMEAHNAGKGAKYTRSRRPVRCVYAEKLSDKGAALSRERAVKALSRAEKDALIERSGNPIRADRAEL